VLSEQHRLLVVGSDHSITWPVVRATAQRWGNEFDILHLDAHLDLYDAFEGNPYSHACSFARIIEATYATSSYK